MPWDEGFLGARASSPHKAWHSLAYVPHLEQPGTAPWLCLDLAAAVPDDRAVGCSMAGKLSGGQGERMRAGTPRAPRGCPITPALGGSQKQSREAKTDAVRGVWRATCQKADVHPLENSRFPRPVGKPAGLGPRLAAELDPCTLRKSAVVH